MNVPFVFHDNMLKLGRSRLAVLTMVEAMQRTDRGFLLSYKLIMRHTKILSMGSVKQTCSWLRDKGLLERSAVLRSQRRTRILMNVTPRGQALLRMLGAPPPLPEYSSPAVEFEEPW